MSATQKTVRAEPHYQPHILLVEDEPSLGKGLEMVLTEDGYSVDLALTGLSALDKFRKRDFDLVVADLRLPDIDGMDVIKRVKERRPGVQVIVITGYSTVSSAVKAMKMGAFDYLPKPFTEEEFKTTVHGALGQRYDFLTKDLLETEERQLIQKREVIRVLEKAAEEESFWRELMDRGSEAIEWCALSQEAKAAIVSGDLNWLRKHVGELSEKQLLWVRSRLEREAW